MRFPWWLVCLAVAHLQYGHCYERPQVKEWKDASKPSNTTTEDFQLCFKDSKMVVVTNTSYFEEDTTHVNDHPVRVLGLTKNCLVYFGWLHEIYTSIVKKPLSLRRGFTDACTDLTPFIIRTENDNKKQLLFLALKRYGRRIMVQSIASESVLFPNHDSTETGGVVWTMLNPRARHEQFLSNEFPSDFTYDACISLFYRAYLMGHSSQGTRILEMKVAIDNNDNLVPFITSLALHVDPVIHAPFFGTSFVAKFNFQWGINNETKGHGFVFIRQLYEGDSPLRGKYKAVAVPMASLLTRTFAASRPDIEFRGHIFQNNYVTVYHNRKCSYLGYYRMSRQLAYPNWTMTSLPPAEIELGKVTKRRFFNPLRFHRRMSYPHTIHRAQRHSILRAWIKSVPAIIINCAVLGLIVCGIEWCISWHEIRKARRSGLSRSYSANTF